MIGEYRDAMDRPTAVSTRKGRVVFFVGGTLFFLSGMVALLQTPLTPLFEWMYRTLDGATLDTTRIVMQYAGGALSAIAIIVFAVGTREGGSVVARKPVGVIALILFAVWPYVTLVIWTVVPYETMAALPGPPTIALSLVPVVAGLIGVVEIVRARAVPGGWRWLPALAYLVIVGPIVLVQLAQDLGWGGGQIDAPVIMIPFAVSVFAAFVVPLVLGATAIGLALLAGHRARRSEARRLEETHGDDAHAIPSP